MPKEETLEIRKNVIKYYDEYLSNVDFIKRFESHNGEISTIMLHPRWINNEVEGIEGQSNFKEIKELLRNRLNLVTDLKV